MVLISAITTTPLLVSVHRYDHYIVWHAQSIFKISVFCAKPSNMGQFFAAEVSRLAGFEKPWMLIHLERSEIFVRENFSDKRHGRVRKYSFKDIVVLRSIKKMLDVGLRPIRVKEVLSTLAKEEGLPSTREAAELFARRRNSAFFITKESVLFAKSEREIVNLAKGAQLSFSFMISVSGIINELTKVVELYEQRRKRNWKADEPLLEEICQQAGL